MKGSARYPKYEVSRPVHGQMTRLPIAFFSSYSLSFPPGTKNADEFDFFFVGLQKSVENSHDGNNDRCEQCHNDDGSFAVAKPDNDDWGKGCFGQGVENHQIGLCYIGNHPVPPEQYGSQCTENGAQHKAGNGFC